MRRVVTGALEVERREKRIGSSLQAAPVVHVTEAHAAAIDGLDMAELCITSDLRVVVGSPPAGAFTLAEVPGVGVVPGLAAGEKCGRCWQVLEEVDEAGGLCHRCTGAVGAMAA
ncbi:MAG: hypothetical protein R3C69_19060 [Geminicoccaceae bacterium]